MPQGQGRVRIRRWEPADILRIVEVQAAAWAEYPPAGMYDERMFEMQRVAFPDGQLVAEIDGVIIGYATSEIVQLDAEIEEYSYDELTGAGTFSTHDPAGDTLYGADIAVHPDYRGRGVAGKLYAGRKKLVKRYNLRRMIAFGRIPGYRSMSGELTAREYVDQVVNGERKDMALTAHLKAGYQVRDVRIDLMSDQASANWATLLEMPNSAFNAAKRRLAVPIKRGFRRARVCAAQWRMRPVKSWQELDDSVDFFVNAANEYHCHFLVFPELFTAQMLTAMDENLTSRETFLELAKYHDQYLAMFREAATRTQLYIIGGSHPVLRDDGKLYNVAHLFTPAGNVYTQDKLHITPNERELWDITPGQGLTVFESPFGRFSILVCYDIEFPELARLLTFAGSEVIFVPFSTDDRKAYLRVRYAAQARAVENASYVVISGNTGNLTAVTYMLNYSQSAILTPSDYGFPPEAIAAEADPSIETVAIADLDFASLASARSMGSVRPLQDIRHDLYELTARSRVKRVRVE